MELFIIIKLMVMALIYIPDPQGYDFEKTFNTSKECTTARIKVDDGVCAGANLYVRRLPTLSEGK
jgi:hypothetical protein|tara:strand:- start:86 stop:280 length:195 start_codon:yes stop_codon:yes gene_type:complete